MDVKIRKVTPKDLDAVTDIESQCFPKAEAATKKAFEQRIKAFPESFFVAEIDEKIIGFINGCVINETVIADELFGDISLHVPTGDYQTVFGLDVDINYRRQGVAAQLLNRLIKESESAGRKGVILTCKKALIPYYSTFGFDNKGLSRSQHGGSEWYDMILKL